MEWQMGHSHPDHPTGKRYNASNIFPAGALLDSPAIAKVYGVPENWDLDKCEAFIAASTETDTPLHVGIAHAHLIAAAPEMLAALAKIDQWITDDQIRGKAPTDTARCIRDEVRAAMAKAQQPRKAPRAPLKVTKQKARVRWGDKFITIEARTIEADDNAEDKT
jgi:hypothetical protein